MSKTILPQVKSPYHFACEAFAATISVKPVDPPIGPIRQIELLVENRDNELKQRLLSDMVLDRAAVALGEAYARGMATDNRFKLLDGARAVITEALETWPEY